LIISDHRHNGALSAEEHARTENIKDKELWRVYARGLTGNISGIIFPDWKMIPDDQFPDNDFVGGLDFGWTNDPTCLVKVVRVADSLFVKELCYKPGMPMYDVKQLMDIHGFNDQTITYCDHAPLNVAELRRLDAEVAMAHKPQGSVKAGILLLKTMNVFYTESSKNLREELKKYVWVKDKSTGNSTNVPIDKFNHAIDAVRYAFYTHYFRS
jgi:phage terminase large subunit